MATAAVQTPSDILSSTSSRSHVQPTPSISIDDKNLGKFDVHTVLNFFKDNEDGSPPEPAYINKPTSYERPVATHNVVINDVRGQESDYTLDSHGFQFVPHVANEKEFLDEKQIKEGYYKETEQLLKDTTGASRVFIFDHTIRRQPKDSRNDPTRVLRGPVKRVHIDQSATAARSRVPHHLPELAEKLLQGRVQLINVWRPIKTVKKDPLTVASSHSVSDNDLIPIGLIYPDRQGETLSVRYNEGQKWYYKSQQTPEEVLLIKCFDSEATKESGKAARVPHSAFEIPGKENEEARESIEVRCLVFHEVE